MREQLTFPYPGYKRSPARLRNRKRIVEMDQRRALPGHRKLDEDMDRALAADRDRHASRPLT